MVVKWPAAGLKGCPEQKAQEGQGGCGEEKNEEHNGAKEDLEGVEVAFLLQSLGSLQGGGLAHSNEAVKKPKARQDECPSNSMDNSDKPIRKWRRPQGHASASSLRNDQNFLFWPHSCAALSFTSPLSTVRVVIMKPCSERRAVLFI